MTNMGETIKGKDCLMKKLLSSPNLSTDHEAISPKNSILETSGSAQSPLDENEECATKLSKFLRQLARREGCEINMILMDHPYSRPRNWCADNIYIKPAKTLFVLNFQPSDEVEDKDDLNVEKISDTSIPPYNSEVTSRLMQECETYVNSVKREDKGDDWEELIDRTGWTPQQSRLFNKVGRALNQDQLARLACSGNANEAIQRRIAIDTTARRIRNLLGGVLWDTKLTQWLHLTLVESLSNTFLSAYLEALQTLKAKIPSLIERMICGSSSSSRTSAGTVEALNLIIKQPWDPVVECLNENKPRRLPGDPILLVVPSHPCVSTVPNSRMRQWESYLSSLGTVVSVVVKAGTETVKTTLATCLDQMVCAVRVKIAQVRAEYPGKAVILIGWGTGSSIACQVAMVEQVNAVVCLGFPFHTLEGKRGEPNDSILEIKSPVIFIVGDNATTARPEDIEDMRERMRVETGLVVVGSADDQLRMSRAKKHSAGVTQSMVDYCIMDEVADFLATILMTPRPPLRPIANHTSSPTVIIENGTNIKTDGKRKLLGECPPPVMKRPRLGGRQKSRLMTVQKIPSPQDSKWPDQQISNTDQTDVSGGITVNIGSLGSLTPLGSLRLSQTTSMESDQVSSSGRGRGSLTVQGSVVPTSEGRGRGRGRTGIALHSKQVRSASKGTDGGSITTLSSLLQSSTSRITVSSTSSLLLGSSTLTSTQSLHQQPLKVLSSDGTTGSRIRTTSGRVVDLSKLTVLTSSTGGKNVFGTSGGNVVMLTESSTRAGGRLVPVSSLGSPFAILPISGNKSERQRSYTVVPKISVPSLKLNQQQLNSTGNKLSTYSIPSTLLKQQSQQNDIETSQDEDGETLTPDKILELPIIFAKDDDSIVLDSKVESDVPDTPTVVPITSCATDETSTTLTLGDTISFPLEDNEKDRIGENVHHSTSSNVPNVFIIRSNKGTRGRAQGTRRYMPKTQRFLRTIDKSVHSQISTNAGVKYTKIILTNRNSPLKIGETDPTDNSGFCIKNDVSNISSDHSSDENPDSPLSNEKLHDNLDDV